MGELIPYPESLDLRRLTRDIHRYRPKTMQVEFTGTVARINDSEGLVVFHGGGTYPRNWDLQLRRGDFSFSSGNRYHVVFRLQSVKGMPFSGYSFRGKVISKLRD